MKLVQRSKALASTKDETADDVCVESSVSGADVIGASDGEGNSGTTEQVAVIRVKVIAPVVVQA